MKGKALRRALATSDAIRINADIPLITDTTELISPDVAREMLRRNSANRPINWNRVEEYADTMRRGEWKLHSQGIVLDVAENILTGQKRLWAIVYSDKSVYLRVSRGNPIEVARLLDRGDPQSARDLAARGTGRKHSPVEASIARAHCALMGNVRPSKDALADSIERLSAPLKVILAAMQGTKKTRVVLMVCAAIIAISRDDMAAIGIRVKRVEEMVAELEIALRPLTVVHCWGKGAAFALAMEHARRIAQERCQ